MKKFLTLSFLIIFNQNSICQFAFNNVPFKLIDTTFVSYKIIQYKNNKISRVEETDKEGRIIFEYEEGDIPPFFDWDTPMRFIYANEYDEKGRQINRFNFNSNAGLGIISYEYGKEENSRSIYKREYQTETKVKKNSNAYHGISKINSFQVLVISEETKNIMQSPKTKIGKEYFNEQGDVIKEESISEDERFSKYTLISYDDESKESQREIYSKSNDELTRKIINEYPNDTTEIKKIIGYRNSREAFKYLFATIKKKEERTEIEYSVTGEELNIRKKIHDGNENVTQIIVYKTEYKGELIIPITSKLEKTAQMKYFYNKKGLLEKEHMNNYQNGKEEIFEYKYEIHPN